MSARAVFSRLDEGRNGFLQFLQENRLCWDMLPSSNTSVVLELIDFRGREFIIALKVPLTNGVLVGCFPLLLHE